MKYLNVETINGIVKESLYEIHELSYLDKLFKSKDSKKRGINYLGIPCAFDIETTNIYEKDSEGKIKKDPRPYAFMYHWQFCFDDQVVFGRRWEEFQDLLRTLEERLNLSDKNRLVVWVHNLPFEWAFMRQFIDFSEGFFRAERDPLKVVTLGGIEFRCSYALSNMSLQKFCENEEDVTHYKLSGDTYDYDKIRTATTTLTDYEKGYCYNDVRGLCECIKSRMKHDSLAHMPMTSTGYVRRDLRSSVKANKKNRKHFRDCEITADLYTMFRDAFRGGNTHANLDSSDQLLHDIWGYDITSSYPYSIMLPHYPVTKWQKITLSTFNRFIKEDNYALLIKCRLKDVRYKNTCGIPYIAFSKLSKWAGKKIIDNGRVLYIEYCEMTITDIDYKIIVRDYCLTPDQISIDEVYASNYGFLPEEIRKVNMDYYRAKTLLKDDPESIYEYVKAKNRLNSIYGCMVMRIDQSLVSYDPYTEEYLEETPTLEEAIKKYYNSRNNFLQYFHGVWITANSRLHLQEMLWKVGSDVVYTDTDSIKGMGDHDRDFARENQRIIEKVTEYGGFADDKEGKRHYLGVWDCETRDKNGEHRYIDFKTLGAKKYVYSQEVFNKKKQCYEVKIKSTIAGVSKKVGSEFFTEHGIDSFEVGTRITDSGHLTAYYNDDKVHEITVKGCTMTTGANVALINNSYKIGVTEEYSDLLLKGLEKILDIDYI